MAQSTSYHHGNLRQALIAAGTQLLESRELSEISLREVAKLAGVSHSAPYRHFRDKNALLSAIAQVGFERLNDDMRQAVLQNPDNPREQLIAAGVAYIKLALANTELFHLMFASTMSAEHTSDVLQQTSNNAFQGLVSIIKNGQQSGQFKPADVGQMAISAWSIVHGYAMLASSKSLDQATQSQQDTLKLASIVEAHLIDGLSS